MCEIGDILLIYNARNKRPVGMHPFIVLDDSNGIIRGTYEYDFIALLMTSADTDEKKRTRNLDGNFPIASEDKTMIIGSKNLNAYVEADQLFFFDKSKIKYKKIGTLDPDIHKLVLDFIYELSEKGVSIHQIFDKANKIDNT